MVICIKYTAVPVVFCTGSHFSEIEVKVLFVTLGMPGVGDVDPSPSNIEERLLICVKHLQLASQLLEFNCKRREGISKGLHVIFVASLMISNNSYFKVINHSLISLSVILRLLLLIFFTAKHRLAGKVSPFLLALQ